MRLLTPEVAAALEQFDLTHQVTATAGGVAYMVRTALPRGGGLAEQDAREIETLEWLRQVHDALLGEQRERMMRDRAIDQWRTDRRRER